MNCSIKEWITSSQNGAWYLKKIVAPVWNLKAKKKTKIVDQIRVDQQNLPKKKRYGIGELLKTIDLKRPTYYDERKRIINKNDKYADVRW